MIRVSLAAVIVCVTAFSAFAQRESTVTTDRKTFEILGVDGNQLLVSLPEGTKELTVPDDFRFNVNGQMLSVQQLKPGMKGTAVITTRTTMTPVTVTEVKNGTVMKQTGSTIMIRTNDGVKNFTQADLDKRGIKMMRDGKPAQLTDFREGDLITASIVTTKPAQVMSSREVQASLASAAPPAAAPRPATASAPARSPAATSAPASASAQPSPAASQAPSAPPAQTAENRTLPKTASSWPTIGFISGLLIATGLVLSMRRRQEL